MLVILKNIINKIIIIIKHTTNKFYNQQLKLHKKLN